MDYQLCWCQPADGRFGGPVIACDEPQHFLAHIGTVAGREGWVKWRGHGIMVKTWLKDAILADVITFYYSPPPSLLGDLGDNGVHP